MGHNLDILIRNDEYSAECCIYIKRSVLLKQKETGNSRENPICIFFKCENLSFYSEFKAAM